MTDLPVEEEKLTIYPFFPWGGVGVQIIILLRWKMPMRKN